MQYVLLIFIYTGVGIDVRSADFTTKEACEAAKAVVFSHMKNHVSSGKEVATCVAK